MKDNAATLGTTLATFVLQTQILHTLIRTGLLSKERAAAMLDAAILVVEEWPRDEDFSTEIIAVARQRLINTQRLIEASKSFPDKGPN